MNREEILTVGALITIAVTVFTQIRQVYTLGKAKGELDTWRQGVDKDMRDVKAAAAAANATTVQQLAQNNTMQGAIERTQAELLTWRISIDKTLDNYRVNHISHFEHAGNTEVHMSQREHDELTRWRDSLDKRIEEMHRDILSLRK